MHDETDAEVLARSRTHPELLGVIYERHATSVFRYLARRVGVAAAEDLLGDVFVAAVEARLRVRPHTSASALPWLYGIAGNVVRSHLRRSQPRVGEDHEPPFDWDAVDQRIDAALTRSRLRDALEALTPMDREIVLLVAWENLTPAEAGEVLGLTPVAARSRLHRARMHAQALLGRSAPATL